MNIVPKRIYWIAEETNGRLRIMPRPRGADWLDDDIRFLRFQNVAMLVSLLTEREQHELELTDEAAICDTYTITYMSFPIVDRHVPPLNTATVEAIRAVANALRAGKHVVIHCRMGIGRAALIAASVLVLSGRTPAQAFNAITQARGCPVPDTPEQRAWVDTLLAFCKQHAL